MGIDQCEITSEKNQHEIVSEKVLATIAHQRAALVICEDIATAEKYPEIDTKLRQ